MARVIPLLTPLRRIATPGGDVCHGMKAIDPGFDGFGEAYFTSVEKGYVKGWKRHKHMTLNLIVPVGEIQISIRDMEGADIGSYRLGSDRLESYCRLTVPPGFWVAFGGIGPQLNLMLNVASILHDPEEADNLPIDTFSWTWEAG